MYSGVNRVVKVSLCVYLGELLGNGAFSLANLNVFRVLSEDYLCGLE